MDLYGHYYCYAAAAETDSEAAAAAMTGAVTAADAAAGLTASGLCCCYAAAAVLVAAADAATTATAAGKTNTSTSISHISSLECRLRHSFFAPVKARTKPHTNHMHYTKADILFRMPAPLCMMLISFL